MCMCIKIKTKNIPDSLDGPDCESIFENMLLISLCLKLDFES